MNVGAFAEFVVDTVAAPGLGVVGITGDEGAENVYELPADWGGAGALNIDGTAVLAIGASTCVNLAQAEASLPASQLTPKR